MEFGGEVTSSNYKQKDPKLVLMRGLSTKDREMVAWALGAGADPNFSFKDSKGKSYWAPILLASFVGYLEGVELLIRHGAAIDVFEGVDTALTCAATENQEAVVRYLLEKGANPSIPGEDGDTPLSDWGLEDPIQNPEIGELLLRYGASVDEPNGIGAPPIFRAAWTGCLPKFVWLLEHGADASLLNNNSESLQDMINIMLFKKDKAAIQKAFDDWKNKRIY